MYAFLEAGSLSDPLNSATRYCQIDGEISWVTSSAAAALPIPHALTIDSARIVLTTAPGAGKTWTFTLQKNGADTAIVVAITGAGVTSGQDTAHSVSFAQGDTINWKCVPTSTPAAPAGISLSLRQSASGQLAGFAHTGGTGITTSQYFPPAVGPPSAGETSAYAPIALGGSIKNLFVLLDVAPGALASWAVTARKNTADTALTTTVSDPSTSSSDTTNNPTVAAGDLLAFHVVASTPTPASTHIGIGYTVVPTNDGDSDWLSSLSNAELNNTDTYGIPHGSRSSAINAAPSLGSPQRAVQAGTIKGLYVKLTSAPGTGKNFTVAVNKNGTDTGATVTISDSATTGNITGLNISVANDDLICLHYTPSGLPSTPRIMSGIVYATGGSKTITPSNVNSKVTVTAAVGARRKVTAATVNSKVTASASLVVRRAIKATGNVIGRVTVSVTRVGAVRKLTPAEVRSKVTVTAAVHARRKVAPAQANSHVTVSVTRVAAKRKLTPTTVNSRVTVTTTLRVISPVIPSVVNSKVTASVVRIGAKRRVRLPARLQIASLLRRRGIIGRVTVAVGVVRIALVRPAQANSRVTVTTQVVRSGKVIPSPVNSKVTVSAYVAAKRRIPANFVNSRVTVSVTVGKIVPRAVAPTVVNSKVTVSAGVAGPGIRQVQPSQVNSRVTVSAAIARFGTKSIAPAAVSSRVTVTAAPGKRLPLAVGPATVNSRTRVIVVVGKAGAVTTTTQFVEPPFIGVSTLVTFRGRHHRVGR